MKTRYYGWRIVVVGFLMMVCVFTPMVSLIGFLVVPISEDLGTTRAAASLTVTVASAASIATSLFAGKVLARFNIKKVVALFLLLAAVGCGLCAVAPSLALVLVGSALRGVCHPFITSLPLSMLVGNWFGPKLRGRAWAITTMGSGIGVLALSPLLGKIVESFGWRWGYGFYGLMALAMLPLALLFFAGSPKDKGLQQLGAGDDIEANAEGNDVPLGTALRTPALWLFLLAFFLLSGGTYIWNISGAAYLGDIGFSVMLVSVLMSVTSIGITASKLIVGTLCDKYGGRWGYMLIATVLGAAAVVLMLGYAVPGLAWAGAAMMGFGLTGLTITPVLMTRELFGNKDYGPIFGLVQASISLGSTLIPLMGAAAYELTASYVPAWACQLAVSVAAPLCVLGAYRLRAAQRSKALTQSTLEK